MPLLLPRGALVPFNRYAILYQWDLSTDRQLWIRVLFVEGQFYIWEAQTFLDCHVGMQDRSLRRPNPSTHFGGPIVGTMLLIGPTPTSSQTKHLKLFSNNHPNMRYLSAYQWAVTRHHLTTKFNDSKVNLYVLNRPWWDNPASTYSPSPGEPESGLSRNNWGSMT